MILSILCVVCGVVAVTTGQVTYLTSDDLQLTASTHSLYVNYTKSLTVSCNFRHHQNSEVTAEVAIILTKEEGAGFTDVAMVTAATPDSVEVKDALGAKVTGRLRLLGDSSIVYQWDYPDENARGKFQCLVHGMNRVGRPVMLSSVTTIQQESSDVTAMVDKIRRLEHNQEFMQVQVANATNQLNVVKQDLTTTLSEYNAVRQELTTAQAEISQTKHQLQMSNSVLSKCPQQIPGLFVANTLYRNHTYFLSRVFNTYDVWQLASLCQMSNGYLVEFDDQSEYDAMSSFLYSYNNPAEKIIVGVIRGDSKTEWKFMHSGGEATFFAWADNAEPQRLGLDCIWLNWGNHLQFNWPCQTCPGYPIRFICEVNA